MSLDEYQNIIAILSTSKKERNRFLLDRIKFLKELKIDNKTIERLIKLEEWQLNEFSEGLIRKRFGVVKNLLQLNELETETLRSVFFKYACDTPISGRVYKHQWDAYRFCEYAMNQSNSEMKKKLKSRKAKLHNYLASEGEIKPKKEWKGPKFLKFK